MGVEKFTQSKKAPSDICKGKSRKREYISISDSDSDDELLPTLTTSKNPELLMKIHQDTADLRHDVADLRQDIADVLKLTKGMSIPPGLQRCLLDTFKCHICFSSPLRPHAIFARCCKRILGCERCVEQWYEGNEGRSKRCPLCRSERAYSETARILNLDDFLTSIAPLFNHESEGGARTQSPYPSDEDFQ